MKGVIPHDCQDRKAKGRMEKRPGCPEQSFKREKREESKIEIEKDRGSQKGGQSWKVVIQVGELGKEKK